jgi:SAM-dependent methyltransferase
MLRTHESRFNDAFWAVIDAHVRPRLPAEPAVVDLGCGPGLLLQDASRRMPGAKLFGFDLTPAMVEHARTLEYGGDPPELGVLDLLRQPIPLAKASMDVVFMSAVLHLFSDPFTFLTGMRDVLKPAGVFVLYDWVRMPLADYLNRAPLDASEDPVAARQRQMKLFATHNRYSPEDWRWVLGEAGFDIVADEAPTAKWFRVFVATPMGATHKRGA